MKSIKKIKIFAIAVSLAVISLVSFSFTDSYFEVSKNMDIFATLFRELNIYYVDETDPGKLMKSGIDAMLKTLDPYTNYITESEIEDYRFMTTGQYGGIGSLISKRDSLIVISEPYEGSPALKAGLMAGDVILEVNGKSALNKETSEMSKILKGEPGTPITMKIKRPGQEGILEKQLIREEIKINDVPYYGMLNAETGYIKLTSFTETASREVKDAFLDLKDNQGMQSVILDLRGNGGGLLREAVNIVNLFVEKGQEVVSTKGKVKDWDKSHKALNNPTDLKIPLTVLIDEGSASASEIVSGTLQDLDRAVIIGQMSYGKGLVQQTRNLSYNAKLKVTVAKYYTPSGRCIQRLDYANKDDDGKATVVPDSLITAYTTKNGRTVFDGAGITPDIKIERDESAMIVGSLYANNLIFDFATQYRLKHDSIAKAKGFKLTEEEYDQFIAYTEGKDYSYETRTEMLLDKILNASKDEHYSDAIEQQISVLKDNLKNEKNDDIRRHKEKISFVLENEIISRYYYQKGRIEASLASDPEVIKALDILSKSEDYASILSPPVVTGKN